jgi:hypothetical protein
VESSQIRGFSEELCTEFSQREWKLVAGNKIEVESKAEMKAKTGRSPDLADSFAIGLQGAKAKGFVIARALAKRSEGPNGRDWRDEARDQSRALWRSGSLNYT